jgi:hypothetical protein
VDGGLLALGWALVREDGKEKVMRVEYTIRPSIRQILIPEQYRLANVRGVEIRGGFGAESAVFLAISQIDDSNRDKLVLQTTTEHKEFKE